MTAIAGRTGAPAETEARDNLKTLAATLAAYTSAELRMVAAVIPDPAADARIKERQHP